MLVRDLLAEYIEILTDRFVWYFERDSRDSSVSPEEVFDVIFTHATVQIAKVNASSGHFIQFNSQLISLLMLFSSAGKSAASKCYDSI